MPSQMKVLLLSGRYMNVMSAVELDFISGMLTMDDEVVIKNIRSYIHFTIFK